MIRSRVSFAALLLLSSLRTVFAESSGHEALDRMDSEMERIHDRARRQRFIATGIFGVSAVGFGIGALAASKTATKQGAALTSLIFLGASGLVYFVPSNQETMGERYLKLPAGTEEDRRTKLTKGEAYLEEISDSARRDRHIGTAILGAFSVGYFIASAVADPADYSDKNIRTEFLVGGILMGGLAGVIALVPSDSERAYERYERWKSGKSSLADWKFGIFPTPDRKVLASASLVF